MIRIFLLFLSIFLHSQTFAAYHVGGGYYDDPMAACHAAAALDNSGYGLDGIRAFQYAGNQLVCDATIITMPWGAVVNFAYSLPSYPPTCAPGSTATDLRSALLSSSTDAVDAVMFSDTTIGGCLYRVDLQNFNPIGSCYAFSAFPDTGYCHVPLVNSGTVSPSADVPPTTDTAASVASGGVSCTVGVNCPPSTAFGGTAPPPVIDTTGTTPISGTSSGPTTVPCGPGITGPGCPPVSTTGTGTGTGTSTPVPTGTTDPTGTGTAGTTGTVGSTTGTAGGTTGATSATTGTPTGSQPCATVECTVKIDESGTGSGVGAGSGLLDAAKGAADSLAQSVKDAVTTDHDTGFGFSFTLPTATCTGFVLPNNIGTIDPCPAVDLMRQAIDYAWILTTIWLCIGMVKRTIDGS